MTVFVKAAPQRAAAAGRSVSHTESPVKPSRFITSVKVAPAPSSPSLPKAAGSLLAGGTASSSASADSDVGGSEDWMELDAKEMDKTRGRALTTDAQQEETLVNGSRQTAIGQQSEPSSSSLGLTAQATEGQSLQASVVTHAKQAMRTKQKDYKLKPDAYWHERVIRSHDFGLGFIFCVGVSAPCGAIYTSWSSILPVSGTCNLLMSIVAIAVGFVVLCLCLGEMSSAFPFAGGSFGFARALLGKTAGQFVGVAESLEWLLIGVGFISLVSQGCTTVFGSDAQLEGLWLVLLYLFSLWLNLMGGLYLYVPFFINTVVSIAFLVVYQLGMIRYGDWQANAGIAAGLTQADGVTPQTTWFVDGFSGFLRALPYAVFTLVGFEICPLLSDEVVNPKLNVARGMVSSSVLVCGMAVITLFAAVSCPQLGYGSLAATEFPLSDGFALIFGGPDASGVGADPRITVLLPVFTQWAAFLTCNMAWGRQMFAMARSGLLPHWLSATWQRRGTPAAALITGTALSLLAALIVRYMGSAYVAAGNAVLFNIGITGCCINYIFQAASFVMLRVRYNALARPFRSPLGNAGAAYVMLIFGLTLAGVAQYPYLGVSVAALFAWLGLGLLYYFVHARYHLLMSPEEYRSLFLLYSMQFIRQKQKAAIKGGGGGGGGGGGSLADRNGSVGSRRDRAETISRPLPSPMSAAVHPLRSTSPMPPSSRTTMDKSAANSPAATPKAAAVKQKPRQLMPTTVRSTELSPPSPGSAGSLMPSHTPSGMPNVANSDSNDGEDAPD